MAFWVPKWLGIGLVLLGALVEAKIQVEPGTRLPTSSWRINKKGDLVFGVVIQVGSGIEPKKSDIEMMVDLSYSGIIMGDRGSSGWGIDCRAEIGCHIREENASEVFYESLKLLGKKGFAPLTLTKTDKVIQGDYKLVWHEFPVPVAGNKWRFGGMSVLGLSPRSRFFQNLPLVYQLDTGLLFVFRNTNTQPSPQHLHSMEVYLNPALKEKDVLVKAVADADVFAWRFGGSLEVGKKEFDLEKAKVTLSFGIEELLAVRDPRGMCDWVRRQVCPEIEPSKCDKTAAVLSKAPKLSLKVTEKIFDWEGLSYIDFAENGHLVCSFADLGSLKATRAVPVDTDVVLGRRFFERYPVLLQPGIEKPAVALFLDKWDHPQPEPPVVKSFWGYWLLSAAFLAAIASFTIYRMSAQKVDSGLFSGSNDDI